MWLWPGITLLGAMTEGEKVRDQVKYVVESINDGAIRFTCGVSLPADKVADLFVLSYAQTYASCQGTVRRDTAPPRHDAQVLHHAPLVCRPLSG